MISNVKFHELLLLKLFFWRSVPNVYFWTKVVDRSFRQLFFGARHVEKETFACSLGTSFERSKKTLWTPKAKINHFHGFKVLTFTWRRCCKKTQSPNHQQWFPCFEVSPKLTNKVHSLGVGAATTNHISRPPRNYHVKQSWSPLFLFDCLDLKKYSSAALHFQSPSGSGGSIEGRGSKGGHVSATKLQQ